MGSFPKNFFAVGTDRKVFLCIDDIIRYPCPHPVDGDLFEPIVTEETSGAKKEEIGGEIIVFKYLDYLL
jgi:hypothetical protein